MIAARLAVEGIACLRGGRLLFEGLGFALGPGDAAVVTGPNGAGKSSLLRLVAGLLKPAAGRVDAQGGVALADESLALDRRLPLARALGFWAALDGCRELKPALALFDLAHLAEVPVRMLSTGQRKRATLARVAASGAAVWLLDEPANGLDAASLDRLTEAMHAHREQGGIVLAASHQSIGLTNAHAISLIGLQA